MRLDHHFQAETGWHHLQIEHGTANAIDDEFLASLDHLLDQIPYKDLTPKKIKLPPRQSGKGYKPPDFSPLRVVPEVYP